MREGPSSDSTTRERANASQVALVSHLGDRGTERDGGCRAEFRNRRWRRRRRVQESESERGKCNGYAVSGADGTEAVRGCTLRHSCASVSRCGEQAVHDQRRRLGRLVAWPRHLGRQVSAARPRCLAILLPAHPTCGAHDIRFARSSSAAAAARGLGRGAPEKGTREAWLE